MLACTILLYRVMHQFGGQFKETELMNATRMCFCKLGLSPKQAATTTDVNFSAKGLTVLNFNKFVMSRESGAVAFGSFPVSKEATDVDDDAKSVAIFFERHEQLNQLKKSHPLRYR